MAPILGPTLGGWLTDNYSWRWVFYINIPIGILAVILCSILLEDPAYLKGARPGRIDFVGFALLTIWIGCLQVMLDKGQDADWLYSGLIQFLACGAAIGFCAFIIWELRVEHPIVNLRILRNGNLAIGSLLLFLVGAILYGTTAILPLFLQNLISYTSYSAGLVMSPRGFGAIAGSIVSARILANPKIDGRAWIGGGFAILALSMYMFGNLTIQIAPSNIILPIIISGFSVTCIFVPMTTFSMATISRENMGEASGLTNLLRNLGGSVGISAITALVARGTQTRQALLVGHLNPYNPVFNEHIARVPTACAAEIRPSPRLTGADCFQRCSSKPLGAPWTSSGSWRLFACFVSRWSSCSKSPLAAQPAQVLPQRIDQETGVRTNNGLQIELSISNPSTRTGCSKFCLLSLSHRSQLPVQAQEKTEKEEQSESVNDGRVEDKDVELLAEIIFFGTKKYIARF